MREFQTIGEVMTPSPFSVDADAPLCVARGILLRERINHLPVLEEGFPIGMVTDRDLHLVSHLSNGLIADDELTTGDVCVPDPYIVGPDTLLTEVTGILARDRLGAAMITENGKLTGIFTTHDACRLLATFRRTPVYV
ncbi:MAG: CBS domain-containing protein [Planctomycetota bacterium]|jgi:CBS domain-containing protein